MVCPILGRVADESFLSPEDSTLGEQLLTDGYVIRPTESVDCLKSFRSAIVDYANDWLNKDGQPKRIVDLKDSHMSIPQDRINDIRLSLFARLNSLHKARWNYFSLASDLLQRLVGNELAMQNKLNLSIQQPGDQTSVLELHSDVWTGDSPFQVVLWVPLTDTSATNAMFLLPPENSREAYARARAGDLRSMADIHVAYQEHFRTIEVRFGEILVFDSSCLHGNQINTTTTSRWSLNCRVASLMAPATTPERRLGSYYTPIMVRPATRMGLRAAEALGLIE